MLELRISNVHQEFLSICIGQHISINLTKLDDIMETRVEASHLPQEERYRLTLEALADVKAGRTQDHAEIEAWAARLPEEKCAAC